MHAPCLITREPRKADMCWLIPFVCDDIQALPAFAQLATLVDLLCHHRQRWLGRPKDAEQLLVFGWRDGAEARCARDRLDIQDRMGALCAAARYQLVDRAGWWLELPAQHLELCADANAQRQIAHLPEQLLLKFCLGGVFVRAKDLLAQLLQGRVDVGLVGDGVVPS